MKSPHALRSRERLLRIENSIASHRIPSGTHREFMNPACVWQVGGRRISRDGCDGKGMQPAGPVPRDRPCTDGAGAAARALVNQGLYPEHTSSGTPNAPLLPRVSVQRHPECPAAACVPRACWLGTPLRNPPGGACFGASAREHPVCSSAQPDGAMPAACMLVRTAISA